LKQKVIHEIATQGGLENMQFSPDNLWFAMTRVNDAATLFQLKGNKEFPLNLGLGGIESMKIAFSPDGRQLACAALLPQPQGETSRILIYEVASRKVRLELVGHPNAAIESLAYAPDSGLLATGSTDTTVLLWNTGLRAFAKGDGADAKDADLDDWYKKMADANPKVALQNMIQLAQHSKQTIKLLEAKIAPAKKPDAGEKPVPEWINDLGSGQFAVRSKANTMLQKIGAAVEPDLRAALPRAKDVETKRRIEELLEHFASYQWTPEELMQARAVEVIDAIETPEARALLTRWSGGDTGAVLTQQAQKSLDRSK
jgi:hypothetical protein